MTSKLTKPTNNTNTPSQKKCEIIIERKMQNPHVSLKIIAEKEGVNYSYARQVWARYKKERLTIKASPSMPFHVQTFGFSCQGLESWYANAPCKQSKNRNGQKVYKNPYFSFVVHKNGTVILSDYHIDWKKKLVEWLRSWMFDDEIELFFSYLEPNGERHYAFNTPGVVTGYKIKIGDLGTFRTDKTPFRNGTMEYEVNPAFENKLDSISRHVMGFDRTLGQVVNSMDKFGRGMSEHMKLIAQLQENSSTMQKVLTGLVDAIGELRTLNGGGPP